VKTHTLSVTLIFLANGFFFGGIPGKSEDATLSSSFTEKSTLCTHMEPVVNSLKIQRLDASKSESLNSLGIKTFLDHGLSLVGATRITGYCAVHIDEFRAPIIHLDTGITLIIDQDRISPYLKEYYPRFFISENDAHPVIPLRKFIQGIDMGGGHRSKELMVDFIGAWTQNEKSIITPYKRSNSGDFHLYGDLLELDKMVLSVRFLHHLDTPSGLIQILQGDGDDRILLEFIWIYGGLFSD